MVLVFGGGYWLAGIYGALAWVDYHNKAGGIGKPGPG